jgi:hypothetical protein
MDDPLRICIADGRLFARVEAGHGYSTQGVSVEASRWYHVAVVKSGPQLTLYVDGKRVAGLQIPTMVHSAARDFALGGNPHYTEQSEHLACRVAGLEMYARAMSTQEVAGLMERLRPRSDLAPGAGGINR